MRKKILSLISLVLIISCFTACGVTKISLDESDITEYLEKTEGSDDVTIVFDNIDGIAYLSSINNTANTKVMSTWVNVNGYCELKGKYDGVWVYGFGTKDKCFMGISENNKDDLYAVMDGYKEKFKDK